MTAVTDQPILVLDGAERAALAVTRSLGSRGIAVNVAGHCSTSLAGASRYCARTITIANPADSVASFTADVTRAARKGGCRLVLPLTDASLTALYHEDVTAEFQVLGPPRLAYARAADKATAGSLSKALGIAVPNSIQAIGPESVAAAVRRIGLPAIVKPQFSRYVADDRIHRSEVTLISDSTDLGHVLKQPWVSRIACLVQQFVPGRGAGVFILFARSSRIATFAHRRLREKPPAGGVSVLSESATPNADLQTAADRLLNALEWFGPAMVEFRIDPDGKPWFMEINGRFWGSLQLAIDCGVDFPWLFYQLGVGREVEPVTDYAVGRRLRWELGDLDHLLLQLRGKGTAATPAAKLRALGAFLNPVAGRPEVFRPDDPQPFFHELRTWIAGLRR